jgi:hypothetical protein
MYDEFSEKKKSTVLYIFSPQDQLTQTYNLQNILLSNIHLRKYMVLIPDSF